MVKRASAVVVVVAVLVCGAGAASGRWGLPANQAAATSAEALERAIEQELSSRGGVGATVAVVQDGRPLLAKPLDGSERTG